MPPRRRRRPPPDPGPGLRGGWVRVEDEWVVRSVSGSAAVKDYRCPGCEQEIRAGTPHVVAWPAAEPEGTVSRRHWHTSCWRRSR